LNFVWSEANAAFVSQRTLPVVVTGGRLVYKEIPGMIVIEKRGSKNRLFIYFEVGKEFFFFQFEDNILYAVSSDKQFNDAISNTKAKDKVLRKNTTDGSSFQYKLGKRGEMIRFVRKYYELPEEE